MATQTDYIRQNAGPVPITRQALELSIEAMINHRAAIVGRVEATVEVVSFLNKYRARHLIDMPPGPTLARGRESHRAIGKGSWRDADGNPLREPGI